jgi:hypothetical protein
VKTGFGLSVQQIADWAARGQARRTRAAEVKQHLKLPRGVQSIANRGPSLGEFQRLGGEARKHPVLCGAEQHMLQGPTSV